MPLPPPTPPQARIIWWALTALSGAALMGVGVGLVWALGEVLAVLSPVLWPLAVAGVIAYLLDPVVDFLQQRKVPRSRAIPLVFAVAGVAMIGLFAGITPQIYREVRQFVQRVPGYSERLQGKIDEWMTHPPGILQRFMKPASTNAVPGAAVAEPLGAEGATTNEAPTGLAGQDSPAVAGGGGGPVTGVVAAPWLDLFDRSTIKSASTWLGNLLTRAGQWLLGKASKVGSVFGVLAGLALVPVYAFYFLLEKEGIASSWTHYVPLRNSWLKDEFVFILRAVNDYLIVFFRSQVLVAACDGVLYTIGFLSIGLPYAVLLGVMATFLTMIPFLGAIATCLAALVIAFAQFGDWLHPLLVLVVFGVVQAIEGLVISPKIMGDRVGLHPLTIIVAVVVGTTLLGGILGGILAIPLTAALRVLMFRYVWRRRGEA